MTTDVCSCTLKWRCEPPSSMALPGEVHLWRDDGQAVIDFGPTDAASLLSAEERDQQQRFLTPVLQSRFLRRRVMLRQVLSRYRPDVLPERWRFTHNAQGRPAIDCELFGDDLHFNVSHSNSQTLVAIAARCTIGVDIEHMVVASSASHLDVARHYFTPFECSHIDNAEQADRLPRFFDLWTLKEAFIKARGLGLSLPLDHFQFVTGADGSVQLQELVAATATNKDWQFASGNIASHYRYAIALQYPATKPIAMQYYNYSRCLQSHEQTH